MSTFKFDPVAAAVATSSGHVENVRRILPRSVVHLAKWQDALSRMQGAYSPHTIRCYASDFRSFERWCDVANVQAFPASIETISAFLTSESSRLKPSSLTRHFRSINKIHRLAGWGDIYDEEIDLVMRRARRSSPSRPTQAFGVTADIRDRLFAACGDGLIGQRDAMILAVGYDTLCRRGELVALRIEDVFQPFRGRNAVLVRRGKSDPDGMGRTAHLSTQTAAIVQRWLEHFSVKQGPLVRPVYRGTIVNRYLNPFAISRILKKLAERAGLDDDTIERISGHSLRVGAAQQLMIDGFGILPIMHAGGWRTFHTVARYVENADFNIWDNRPGRLTPPS